MISIWQNKIIILIASSCVALLLAFAVLPNIADKISQQNWSGSHSEVVNFKIEGFSAPIVAQLTGISGGVKFPKLNGRVVDNANLINSLDEANLIEKLAGFEKRSSDQLVVATIQSLQGQNLEEYSNLLFREWGLGQAEENNGVLLLISKADRKIRIEVGYGLEGILTDAASKTIIDQFIVPQFKIGNFSAGIVGGAEKIISVLSGDEFELQSRAKRNFESHRNDINWEELLFFIIWGTLFFGPLAFSILAPIFGEKIGPHHYKWLGISIKPGSGDSTGSAGGFGGGFSGGGGGFSGGGGSSGGGGASGGW